MDNLDLARTIEEIEDYLIPFLKLNPYERSLYYHLFRQSRLINKEEIIFVISSAPTTVGLTDFSARKQLRTMDKKGCIKIVEVRRDGLKIKVFLPAEIEGCVVERETEVKPIDIESINFYSDQKYRATILKRENSECFYCLKKINAENYVLDHLTSQMNGGDNSYRNIVAVCHECNSKKAGKNGDDFVRTLYRDGILSEKDLEKRLAMIQQVVDGEIKPEL
ncbi:MAG: HNH endonuclease [Patescibacteria group bacterium]|nr:HNH endonuclease [Patescibacteria group bacterium]